MLNLDTHILIDLMIGHLSTTEENIVRKNDWCISGIVLWEIYKLNEIGRIKINFNNPEVTKFISSLTIYPIDLKIFEALQIIDFKSDPADEIIAATSIAYKIPLLTRDQKILKSKKVPLATKKK